MRGSITTKHVLRHSLLIIREFGLRTYVRCIHLLVTPGEHTFLEALS